MFTVKDLMNQAQAEMGLSDWDGNDFQEGLEVLLETCSAQANLGQRGRQHLADACVHHLGNRLRIKDLLNRYPEILQEEISRPMFLVTFPRSGSSFLHRLLCQDLNIRVPLYGEMWQPAPPVGVDFSPMEREMRIKQADEDFLQPLENLFPKDAAARGTMPAANEPGECYVLFENSFTSFNYTFDYYIPAYLDWLCQLDFRAVYGYFKKQLQVLQWQAAGQPWCMKCADHLLGIEALMDVFPDANIVVIHRDPKEMVPSLGNLQACHMNLWREEAIDPKLLGQYCLERYQRVASQAATLKQRVEPTQYHELEYSQLISNPLGEVKLLMEHFNYPIHPDSAQHLQNWLDAHPKPKNRYSLDTYGLSKASVNESLAVYAQHLQKD
ncbi:sulfotransferase [Planktothrix sp. FACHB-1365]|uniref:sulfotransferase family protein n=1 Tax=Planktothrix sp. FACHB-1365 TaxID=2692855 RepID=UPI001684DF8C|nr:sulfotransferase [Planktothrix sp. FACHB-1365]MBD2483276.1 sulfotransferase [Planktothrix sp. FACHB-1365]